jgi:hypothetical protein
MKEIDKIVPIPFCKAKRIEKKVLLAMVISRTTIYNRLNYPQ